MQVITHICLETFRNSYLIANPDTKEAIIIDPAGIDTRLIDRIENNHFVLKAAVLTSPRSLHERPLRTLRRIYPVEVFCTQQDVGDVEITRMRPDYPVSLLGFSVEPISMSAYSMNTVLLQIGECLFTGDILSAGTIGDPPSSFAVALLKTEILERLHTMPPATIVLPAHGPPTTIEAELRTNPYLQDEQQNLDARKHH
ncbi:hypothetical protein [Spirochaeta africana]|uniref:Zn-dependent hydrolase, glyoxylase n=1 Tax=Spirochaeta africana (strain ATCC 700263 / DSM 8902 / Z-7692) TaxID=889378 RepID=H9UJM0_SPIAZ|nr:hypothetical protein [Spirochaeta africana]AFG37713.1 hypothetical protein Spiaf_1655 [Spirochaeta africana DSM 8902]